MSWLDAMFQAAYDTVAQSGAVLTKRRVLNFVGATVADNPTTGQTDVTIASTRPQVEFSVVDVAAGSSSSTYVSGNINCGVRVFTQVTPQTITGVRFFWKSGGVSKTIKASIWDDAGGSRLASATVAVAATGIYTVSFSSPLVIGSSLLGKLLDVVVWQTDGANYTQFTDSKLPGLAVRLGPSMTLANYCYQAGDILPSNNATSERYAVEPIITDR